MEDPRFKISAILLKTMTAIIFFMMIVRFYLATKMSELVSLIIAIFSTFVATASSEVLQ